MWHAKTNYFKFINIWTKHIRFSCRFRLFLCSCCRLSVFCVVCWLRVAWCVHASSEVHILFRQFYLFEFGNMFCMWLRALKCLFFWISFVFFYLFICVLLIYQSCAAGTYQGSTGQSVCIVRHSSLPVLDCDVFVFLDCCACILSRILVWLSWGICDCRICRVDHACFPLPLVLLLFM